MMSFSDRYQRVLKICTNSRYFGESALYLSKSAPEGAQPVSIEGVPSRELLDIFTGDGPSSKNRKATFGVNLKDLNGNGIMPKEGDFLKLRGIEFKIRDVDADSEGGATLVLLKK